MVKLSVDLNKPKDSSKTDKAVLNGLDYGLHSLNVDVEVLEMSKYVKDYKIILVYVEHESSIVDTSMFDSSPNVNRNMVVYAGISSTVDDFLFKKFKEVELEVDNESEEEESDTEGNDTSGSDSEDLDYDPKHDDVFDDDEHIVEEVHASKTVRIDVQQEPNPKSFTRTFRRVYVCLGALKQGFKACGREILGLDGYFMSNPCPCQILTAVGVDANNEIYPVTCVIVEEKSKAFWCWFLNLLGDDLGIEANFNYTFIRDLYKPLENAAKATFEGEFKRKMSELKSFNSDAYDWLMKIPLEQWSRAYFSGKAKCDILINNICEVFNRRLVDGRDQLTITYLEYIKEYLMKRIIVV
nr:hypothetical protein [Tanacetum cinerariifolium]